jgi:hypothetical protein
LKQRTALRQVIAWLGLAAVCAATLEIAARIDDWFTYRAPVLGTYDMSALFRPTARGWRGVPHASYVKWALNAEGFRGPEIRPEVGQTRVVAYGASETFGIYEDPGSEFPRVLERDLNSGLTADEFEVINAGMPGMRVGSGIVNLYDIGHELHPKVVVIYPTPTHYVGVSHPYCGRPTVMPGPSVGARVQLRILEKLKDRLKNLLPPAGLTLMRKAGIAWSARKDRVLDRVQPQSLEALETDLRCAVKAVRDIGGVPILVTHANRFGPMPRPDDEYWLTGWRLQYPEIRESGLLDLESKANERIRTVAQQEGVKVVDAAVALSGDPQSFADHAHFTNSGAVKMGALLSAAVLETVAASGQSHVHNGLSSNAGPQANIPAVSGALP